VIVRGAPYHRRMRTIDDALERLRRDAVLPLGELVRAVVGGQVRGSWWGHPKGKLIYELASALEESREVLVAKLVDGKLTFLHESLWPALARVVTDATWRRGRAAGLDEGARALLRRVERAGELAFETIPAEERRRLATAKKVLDEELLVLARSRHTESGKHLPVLVSWKRWLRPDVAAAAARLTRDQARAQLAAHGIRLGARAG
jgi:hypothetical protein